MMVRLAAPIGMLIGDGRPISCGFETSDTMLR
jgi:hypothetical protein